jgi:hypothetical protein
MAHCTNCIQTTATITGFVPANCTSTTPCALDAACVIYTGPPLDCSGIATNDDLQTILQKIDPLLCAATGDYSQYNTFCLAPISTQQEFVESISNFVCTLRDEYDTFVDTTFPAYQATIDGRLDALEVPGITCTSASVIPSMTLQQVLNAYCTKFGSIDTLLDVSGADWNQCYVVSPAPTTPQEGFDTLIDQVCILKALVESGGATLPTFNNVGSCLPAPLTASDTLVDTVNKIKTRLCQTGTLDTTTLSWGCVTAPAGAQNLQDALQNILTRITAIAQSLPTQWSGDFTVSNVDNGNLCLGKSIELAPLVNADRLFAVDPSDMSPATFQEKVIPGTNITFDFVTSPGFVIVNSTGGVGTGDHKVMVDASDPSPGYLGLKISSGVSALGISVTPTLDTVNSLVVLDVTVNAVTLFAGLIDALQSDVGLYQAFCSAVAGCPSPCDAPSNVQVVYTPGGTTTTTTTTSTTTTTTTTP